MNITPLYDQVVIKSDTSQTTESGIVIAGKADGVLSRGTVVAVGGGYLNNNVVTPLTVKVGDSVLYSNYGPAAKLSINGEALLILREGEILGVLSGEGALDLS